MTAQDVQIEKNRCLVGRSAFAQEKRREIQLIGFAGNQRSYFCRGGEVKLVICNRGEVRVDGVGSTTKCCVQRIREER